MPSLMPIMVMKFVFSSRTSPRSWSSFSRRALWRESARYAIMDFVFDGFTVDYYFGQIEKELCSFWAAPQFGWCLRDVPVRWPYYSFDAKCFGIYILETQAPSHWYWSHQARGLWSNWERQARGPLLLGLGQLQVWIGLLFSFQI